MRKFLYKGFMKLPDNLITQSTPYYMKILNINSLTGKYHSASAEECILKFDHMQSDFNFDGSTDPAFTIPVYNNSAGYNSSFDSACAYEFTGLRSEMISYSIRPQLQS